MGWCSGTEVFDEFVEVLLEQNLDKKDAIRRIAEGLRDLDWDCESDSRYWDHPIVQEVFKELEPEWFEDED